MTQNQTETAEQTDLAKDPEATALVKVGVLQILQGKMTLSDLIDAVVHPTPKTVEKKPPVPQSLTPEVIEAIQRLPEVFGKTVVTADRALTNAELKAIVEERATIDKVLTPLTKRKDESIREVLANHMDHKAERDENREERTDAKGHYAPWETQNLPVEGTDLKVQRFATGGKPKLTIAQIEALHAEGKIDRPTYLAITKKPEQPRVLDEDGLHKAIQKDPALFFLLASVAEPTTPTTTVKVVKNS